LLANARELQQDRAGWPNGQHLQQRACRKVLQETCLALMLSPSSVYANSKWARCLSLMPASATFNRLSMTEAQQVAQRSDIERCRPTL